MQQYFGLLPGHTCYYSILPMSSLVTIVCYYQEIDLLGAKIEDEQEQEHEDIGVVDEPQQEIEELMDDDIEDDLKECVKDPDWNACMEEGSDSSDEDGLDEEEIHRISDEGR